MTAETNTTPNPEGLDIKNYILTLEMVTEVKNALGGLVDYDTANIPLRKASVQIVLPKETVRIPLDELFTEETPEDRKNAYFNRRFRTFQELAAWGCLSETKFLPRDSESITLMKGRINEGKFNPIYDLFVKTYPLRAEEIKRLAGTGEGAAGFVGSAPSAQSEKKESPIKLSLPKPVQWEKAELKIKDGRQDLEIFYDKSLIMTVDYVRLGLFSGRKQQKSDRRWGFLCALATLAATDIKQATAENMRGMITKGKNISTNNVQQAKKSLVKWLQDTFETREDPFRDNRVYYEPKFALSPEPALRREEPWPQGGRLNENRGDETDRRAYEEQRAQEDTEA